MGNKVRILSNEKHSHIILNPASLEKVGFIYRQNLLLSNRFQTVYKPAVLPASPARVAAGGENRIKSRLIFCKNNFFYKLMRAPKERAYFTFIMNQNSGFSSDWLSTLLAFSTPSARKYIITAITTASTIETIILVRFSERSNSPELIREIIVVRANG